MEPEPPADDLPVPTAPVPTAPVPTAPVPTAPVTTGPQPPVQVAVSAMARAMRWWKGRRLNIGSLAPRPRGLAAAGLVTCGVAGALIVAVGAKWSFPFGIDPTLRGRALARVVILFCFVGLGVASALLTASVRHRGRIVRRATFLAVAILGAGLSAGTILSVPYLDGVVGSDPFVALAAGWLGMASAAALALMPDAAVGRLPWIRPALAAMPFAFAALAYLGTTGPALPGSAFGLAGGQRVLPRDVIGQTVETVTGGLAVGLAILVLWGAMQSSRLALALGGGAVDLLHRAPRAIGWVFGVALIAKVVALALGYAGALPSTIGGASWDASLHNGPVAWMLAILFAAAATVWLARTKPRALREDDASAPAWSVVVGFTAVFLAATALFMFVLMALLLPSTKPAARLEAWSSNLLDFGPALWGIVATVVLATVAGVVLYRSGRRTAGVFFLLALGAWALPRALTVACRLITDDVLFANITPLTMDTAITVGLALLAVLWLAGRQRAAPPAVLLFVLIVSTLVAGPGLLLPVFWNAGFLFYLSLVFPVAYQFLFRARELNEPGAGREGRVLWEVGMSCALLTIAAFRAAAGLALPGGIDPVTQLLEDAGTLYLMIPFAAILVAAAVTSSGPAVAAAPTDPPTAGAGTAPARTA